MRKILLLPFLLWGIAFAQKPSPSPVQSGPMVGYSEMREVMLWVQTKAAGSVQFVYWERDLKNAPQYKTTPVNTTLAEAYTAHCVADQVQPGKKYEAKLLIDGKPVNLQHPVYFQSRDLWQWRHDPPAFRAAIGSCNFVNDPQYDRPGTPYGGDQAIFQSIHASKPDLMVWLGDNIYLREPDWNTRTGIHYRYTHSRSTPELQPLLSQTHHYAIWDDHDFGPNDSDHSFVHKDKTLEAFKLFWANPSYGVGDLPGTTSQFQWADCDFFLLDNRYHRTGWAHTVGEPTMLGEHQFVWLIDALKASQAPFKFVCIGGMVLSSAPLYENYSNVFPEERQALLDAIQRESIKGVIFLTGDRHHSEMTKYHPAGGIPVYDLTISPLTSKSYPGDGEQNQLLVKGSEVTEANFAILEVTGPRVDRTLKIQIMDAQSKVLWENSLNVKDFNK